MIADEKKFLECFSSAAAVFVLKVDNRMTVCWHKKLLQSLNFADKCFWSKGVLKAKCYLAKI